jgi:signal transduction histidine kinase
MLLELAIGVGLGALVAAPVAWTAARRSARKVKRRVEEAESRARNSERLAYIGQLAGGLAHEIKNPLGSLSLNLQLLAEDIALGDESSGRRSRRRIEALQHETERLAGVLDDFLRFARGYKLDLSEGDVAAVVGEVIDFIEPEARQHGVEIRRDLRRLPTVRMDVSLLKQALFNVLVNARQATPRGGDIMVQCERRNGEVRVHITDTGLGIPSEDLDRIFRPYYSTKTDGTGLGLPTTRRIVEEHGGAVRVHSEAGKGSRFSIALPLHTEAEEQKEA